MILKKLITRMLGLMLLIVIMNSCVSSRMYQDLQDIYDEAMTENQELWDRLNEKDKPSSNWNKEALDKKMAQLESENRSLAMELAAQKNRFDRLQESYDAMEANSSASLSDNLDRNRALLIELAEKEKALNAEASRLDSLQRELEYRSERITELEGIISSKDKQMRDLKDAISRALTNFEGNGLTVEQRGGKIYVSMENKLLFQSGSWAVNSRGRKAVEALGSVLAQNPQIDVLIEGHTDNVPYGGNGNIKDNWDLSTKRATSIVAILSENSGVSRANLTAAGRSEYAPVTRNSTAEGRASNRRIEVILSPKLDEISKMLEDF
ncbi:OmpA/MotB family protein [Aureitalea marina]|uniref:Cell envelope biogenesis protein OmpA n=1 Tax=Aureitalea marina TaxID=930804 RepID=A0A2S7KSQ2_9FLAO|nr:OmpA family protein [Aureitalea marina]PQB05655.1 cell envelope biogenesis protein OmpA [Aureitalea marina]